MASYAWRKAVEARLEEHFSVIESAVIARVVDEAMQDVALQLNMLEKDALEYLEQAVKIAKEEHGKLTDGNEGSD